MSNKQEEDDNHVIAPMDVEGMRDGMFHVRHDRYRDLRSEKQENDQTGTVPEKKEKTPLTKDEQKLLTRGIWLAYLVTGLVFIGIFALFFLFCQFVWFA